MKALNARLRRRKLIQLSSTYPPKEGCSMKKMASGEDSFGGKV